MYMYKENMLPTRQTESSLSPGGIWHADCVKFEPSNMASSKTNVAQQEADGQDAHTKHELLFLLYLFNW